jgi:hypothetical protein
MRDSRKISTLGAALVISTGLGAAVPADASSFREVREAVYKTPLTQLPFYDLPLAKAIWQALTSLSGELIDRGRWTLEKTADFKPSAPKIIHPVGVCADGWWTVRTRTFATGLLSPADDGSETRVRAIVRFSVAKNDPVYKPGLVRNMGIAVKLFPTQEEKDSVLTRNVFTLDQTGLTGDDRASIFFTADHAPGAVFFTNSVAGKGFLSWLGQRTFEKLDPPSTIRALYPLAEVTGTGAAVARAAAPSLIRIVPTMAPKPGAVPADFRDEILKYHDGEMTFNLVLPRQYGLETDTTIGTLVLGEPVVSDVCDKELTFHHAPENRALEEK